MDHASRTDTLDVQQYGRQKTETKTNGIQGNITWVTERRYTRPSYTQ